MSMIYQSPPSSPVSPIFQRPPHCPPPLKRRSESQDLSDADKEHLKKIAKFFDSTIPESQFEISPLPKPKPRSLNEASYLFEWEDFNRDLFVQKKKNLLEKQYIENASGIQIRLQRQPIGEGNYSIAKILEEGQPPLIPGINNSQIVCKIFKEQTKQGHPVSLKEALFCSIKQYRTLEEDFKDLPFKERPYSQLYNIDSIPEDGYALQEKVTPITLPWNKEKKIADLSRFDLKILNQIKKLFHYSFYKRTPKKIQTSSFEALSPQKNCDISQEETRPAPGLDLWPPNLGIRPGTETLVIYDFREDDDPFCYWWKTHLRNLSNENQEIKEYILEGLEDRLFEYQDLVYYYNDLTQKL